VRPRPQDGRDDERRKKVREVDEPGRVVPPLQVVRAVPEMDCSQTVGIGLPEDRGLDADLRQLTRREDEAVGEAAEPVVEEEHREERRPLDHEPGARAGAGR